MLLLARKKSFSAKRFLQRKGGRGVAEEEEEVREILNWGMGDQEQKEEEKKDKNSCE